VHFPASTEMVLRWCAMFSNAGTLSHYITHLKWAHRFLRLGETWYTRTVQQAVKGIGKTPSVRRPRVALKSKVVQSLIKEAVRDGHSDMACLMAVGRLFLLRIPSEGVPLEWSGEHSKITLTEEKATILLARRKNSNVPVELTRKCCCLTSGRTLCAVHWLLRHRATCSTPRLFNFTVNMFVNRLRVYVHKLGHDELY
jgi:hypothetical protein